MRGHSQTRRVCPWGLGWRRGEETERQALLSPLPRFTVHPASGMGGFLLSNANANRRERPSGEGLGGRALGWSEIPWGVGKQMSRKPGVVQEEGDLLVFFKKMFPNF